MKFHKFILVTLLAWAASLATSLAQTPPTTPPAQGTLPPSGTSPVFLDVPPANSGLPSLLPGTPGSSFLPSPEAAKEQAAPRLDPKTLTLVDGVARAWLQSIDVSHFTEAWKSSSKVFQTRLSLPDWIKGISSLRTPLGKPTADRVLSGVKPATSIPGGPDSEYISLNYTTQFGAPPKPAASEFVTVILDEDGTWRVVGYGFK